MASIPSGSRDSFGSKFGILAAAAGSAIGLGNIWRFPYIAGNNGGGAFLVLYLFFVLAIGIPVMLTEFTIGRKGQLNAFGSFKKLAPKSYWWLIGVMGIIAAFTILSFYSTVAGWTLEYLLLAFKDGFASSSAEDLQASFAGFLLEGWMPVLYQIIFMGLTGFVVYSGIKNGIEKYTKILMPILMVLIIILDINSLTLDNASKGIGFLFNPDFSKINSDVILEALGQAFFSLSIGMGVLITYGSYIQKKESLGGTSLSVSMADTLIAILAGVAIFPAVFSFNVEPTAGPGLVFVTLPLIFENMAGGYYIAIIFFILLAIAALTSTISVLEVVVAFLVEEWKMKRKTATVISAVSISILGIGCTLSQGPMAEELKIFGKSLFDSMDFLSANILLPFGGLLIVIFAGWVLGKEKLFGEISNEGKLKIWYFNIYFFIIKFLAPIAIGLVFLNGLQII